MRRIRLSLRALAGPAALLFLLVLAACGEPDPQPEPVDLTARLAPGEVRAGIIEDEAALIGGPKADGQLGDVKLYNSEAAFIVEAPRRASGYRYWGGNLADADVIRAEGEPSRDLYGEIIFAWNLMVFEPRSLEVISDGTNGEAHVRLTGVTANFDWADAFIRDVVQPDPTDFALTYDYRLRPDERRLHLTISVTNMGSGDTEVTLPLIFSNHGDGVEAYAPGGGYNELTGKLPYAAAAGRDLSYGMMAFDDDLSLVYGYKAVILMTQQGWAIASGDTYTFDYDFVVTDGGPAGLDLARSDLYGYDPGSRLTGTVSLPGTIAPESAWVAVRNQSAVATIAPVRADGSFEAWVEPGLYEVHAYARSHAPATPTSIDVAAGSEASVNLAFEEAGSVTSMVVDQDGSPVSARVTFLREGATPSAWAPAEVRHGASWGNSIGDVAYVLGAPETILLPAGSYRAIASRGMSYEMDETMVSVTSGGTAEVSFVLEKVVDTTGWVSADFHIHALRSPDSVVPYDIRAKQAATDDLDVPVLTEHVMVSGLQPAADAAGIGDEIVGVIGQEVTTFAYGHFNAFPLIWTPSAVNQGAVFEHGRTPAELFADIREQNPDAEVVQVNHPRSLGPGGYFSWIGLDAANDTTNRPDDWSTNWDIIEVFNGGCSTSGDNGETLADWIGLTNNGHKKALASGSDTHGESRPPGIPRNWIQVTEAELRADHQALVEPVKARRMVVSCGPFVEFAAADGTGLGEMTGVDTNGEITFVAKVQAPSWMAVDEVRLWENGVPVQSADISAETGVVRFDGSFTVTPTADAWYALEVVGSGSLFPAGFGGPPYALTNPIEVDADGNGSWTPPGG